MFVASNLATVPLGGAPGCWKSATAAEVAGPPAATLGVPESSARDELLRIDALFPMAVIECTNSCGYNLLLKLFSTAILANQQWHQNQIFASHIPEAVLQQQYLTMTKTAEANGNAAKKKAAPKSRKRKTSDVGAAAKTGISPAKRLATDAAAAVAVNGSGAEAHAVQAQLKPFVRGELVESIKHMLFGFGDEAEPMDETSELMEDLAVEYVHAMTKKAMELATIKGKLDTECFIFLIRKDPERYDRIAELLRANDEFRAALNSGFDPSDEKIIEPSTVGAASVCDFSSFYRRMLIDSQDDVVDESCPSQFDSGSLPPMMASMRAELPRVEVLGKGNSSTVDFRESSKSNSGVCSWRPPHIQRDEAEPPKRASSEWNNRNSKTRPSASAMVLARKRKRDEQRKLLNSKKQCTDSDGSEYNAGDSEQDSLDMEEQLTAFVEYEEASEVFDTKTIPEQKAVVGPLRMTVRTSHRPPPVVTSCSGTSPKTATKPQWRQRRSVKRDCSFIDNSSSYLVNGRLLLMASPTPATTSEASQTSSDSVIELKDGCFDSSDDAQEAPMRSNDVSNSLSPSFPNLLVLLSSSTMAYVTLTNITVLDNPTAFTNPFQFEVTFECAQPLEAVPKMRAVTKFGGGAGGPVPVGTNKFVFQSDPPNPDMIPDEDKVGVTVALVTCSYRGREFVRVGYYVNNDYADPFLLENPPARVDTGAGAPGASNDLDMDFVDDEELVKAAAQLDHNYTDIVIDGNAAEGMEEDIDLEDDEDDEADSVEEAEEEDADGDMEMEDIEQRKQAVDWSTDTTRQKTSRMEDTVFIEKKQQD
ncbi:Histone-fold [Phytophthora cactorum]|nr:Histone-fold [Phytophthora cactorum]